jgi:hypothetical protein
LTAEIPGVEEITLVGRPAEDIPEHGGVLATVGAEGLIAVIDGSGMIGMMGAGTTGIGLIPALPISNEPNGIPTRATPPGVVGDVAATDEALLPAAVPHGPDIAVVPGIDAPVPIPIPPPSKVVVEPGIADDALPVVGQGNGLSPGDASCVAPMAIPVGATDEPGVMPSGEVAPMLGVGLPIPPTCAKAEPQLNSIAKAVIIAERVIMRSTFYLRSRH